MNTYRVLDLFREVLDNTWCESEVRDLLGRETVKELKDYFGLL